MVSDTWPAGFSQGTVTDSYGSVSYGTGGTFTAALGTLAAGASKSITVTYTVPASTLPGTRTNSVSVTSDTNDPVSSNNSASDPTTVATSADLSITKSDGQTTVTA